MLFAEPDIVGPHRYRGVPGSGVLPLSAAQHEAPAIDQIGADPASPENIGSADEARDKFRPRLLINLLGRAYLLGASVVHYDDEVGSRHRFGLVVRHVNRGVFVGVVQTADLEPHLLAQIGVEVRERLIEQQRLRLDDEGASKPDALLLTAGELAWVSLGELHQMSDLQDSRDPPLDFGLGDPAEG